MSLHDGLHKSVLFFFEILFVKAGGRKDALFVGLLLGGRACVLTVGVSSVCAGLGSSGGVLESGG